MAAELTNNKKIVLATAPDFNSMIRCSAPLGLAYIAACLEREGYELKIIDSQLHKYSVKKAARLIVDQNPDAVGLTASTHNRFNAIELSKIVKKLAPNIFIFVGGPHFSATAEDALQQQPSIDAVIIGEGEYSTVELLNSYFLKGNLLEVKGICFRDKKNNNRIIKTEKNTFVQNLDSLPMPAYHLLELKRYPSLPYYLTNLTKEEKKLPSVGVISSRGCPNSCIFCANNSETLKTCFRKRNFIKFVDEIQYLHEKYGFLVFSFWDDTLTLSKQYVLDICKDILKRGLKIKWFARARVNTIDKEMLLKMKEAGCVSLLFGAESGSEKILNIIKKDITIEQIKTAVFDSVRMGFDVSLGFMISLPQEIKKDVICTLNLIKTLRSYGEKVFEIDLTPTIIYPGTVIEKIALKEGRIFPENFSWNKKIEFQASRQVFVNSCLPIYTQQFTPEEILEFRLRNKYQQQLKQSKLRLFSKGLRFIAHLRNLNEFKTIILIFKLYISRKNKEE